MIKDSTYDESKKPDLIEGRAAISVILNLCNNAAARASRITEVAELVERVDDWKGHKVERFGELIISGTHTVLKDDAAKTGKERDVSLIQISFLSLPATPSYGARSAPIDGPSSTQNHANGKLTKGAVSDLPLRTDFILL